MGNAAIQPSSPPCPLCHSTRNQQFFQEAEKDYWQCTNCQLVFLDPAQRLSKEEEQAYYQTHKNDPEDLGYRKFLSRLSQPLLEAVTAPAKGLDFGCGPGPTLSIMLEEAGFEMHNYDPLFFPEAGLLEDNYEVITCTEVLEHLHNPGKELSLLTRLLHSGGTLAVMTGFTPSAEEFERWHYRRDPTHVCFFGPATFQWIAEHFSLRLRLPDQNIALLKKQ